MAEKYYEIMQTSATGNGSITTYALVTNPRLEGAGIRATKVGEFDGKAYWDMESGRKAPNKYIHITPCDYMIVGQASCEERTDNPFSDTEDSTTRWFR